MKIRPLALALTLALAVLPASGQTLYKCVVDGKTAYQSEPCAAKASQSEIRAPAPAPSAPPPAPDPKAAAEQAAPAKGKVARMSQEEIDVITDTFVGYAICNEGDPAFGAKLAVGFEGWKERNAASLQRFNQDPEAARQLDARLQAERQRQRGDPGEARAARLELCVRTAGRIKPLAAQ